MIKLSITYDYPADMERDQQVMDRIERYNFDPMHFKDHYVGQMAGSEEEEE